MTAYQRNRFIAGQLREAAGLLEQQGANPYRVNAYRKAANTVEEQSQDLGLLLQSEGFQGLTALPGVGPLIGGAIIEMIETGSWLQLERLRGAHDPESVFRKVPGVGPKLAKRIIDKAHIESLEGLETASHDGRLQKIPGFGPRRIVIIRAALSEMLGRRRFRPRSEWTEPAVTVLLKVDREYREQAAAGTLPCIAPRRFNPKNEAWLPVLHIEHGYWQFTAFYSNTELAHRLGRTRDWVVIYFQADSHLEGQRTVVTETRGPLTGKRVVRGREEECEEYYNPQLFTPSAERDSAQPPGKVA